MSVLVQGHEAVEMQGRRRLVILKLQEISTEVCTGKESDVWF